MAALVSVGTKVHLSFGYMGIRKRIDGLVVLALGTPGQEPFSGHLFVFRGREASLLKILFLGRQGALPFHQAA